MDYYLFAARSVTHAQRMARLLSDAGISAKIRRAGAAITERGCGYTLEIPRRHAARAMQAAESRRTGAGSGMRIRSAWAHMAFRD